LDLDQIFHLLTRPQSQFKSGNYFLKNRSGPSIFVLSYAFYTGWPKKKLWY